MFTSAIKQLLLDSHGGRLEAMTPFLESEGIFFLFKQKRKSSIYVAYTH